MNVTFSGFGLDLCRRPVREKKKRVKDEIFETKGTIHSGRVQSSVDISARGVQCGVRACTDHTSGVSGGAQSDSHGLEQSELCGTQSVSKYETYESSGIESDGV